MEVIQETDIQDLKFFIQFLGKKRGSMKYPVWICRVVTTLEFVLGRLSSVVPLLRSYSNILAVQALVEPRSSIEMNFLVSLGK